MSRSDDLVQKKPKWISWGDAGDVYRNDSSYLGK